MRKLLNYIIGDAEHFTLRHRMANTILIISALFGLQATIANSILGLPDITIYGSFGYGIILYILYYFARFKNKLEIAVLIALFIVIFFYTPVMWIGNAGSVGGAVFYIFLYGAFIISILKGYKAWIYVIFLTLVSLTMLFLEYTETIKIYPYATDFDRVFDLAVSFTFVIFGISIIIYIYTKQFYKTTNLLSEKNDELEKTNKKILIQKTEIEAQRDEIETQRDSVIKQKERVEEIHQALSDSIDYAKRIQESILPQTSEIEKYVSDFFIYYKPRDIVSGDFYWFTHKDNYTIIAAADCTGHGVPGAFMSVLGISLLHDIIEKENCINPGKILDKLRKEVITALNQKGKVGEQKDGMDITLVCINHETNILKFSGANNPLYIIKNVIASEHSERGNLSNNEEIATHSTNARNDAIILAITHNDLGLYEIKPNKMPIAIYNKMEKFDTQEIKLEKGDQIYLFSDGYVDQFGGEKGRKFMSKRFKQTLIENSQKPMQQQKENLNTVLKQWQGNKDQIDDILVLGVKL